MRFNLTEDDFLKGKLVDPGWQSTKIVDYNEKTSKPKVDPQTGQQIPPSMYAELKFEITTGKDKGVILYNNFSEKAPGFIIPFLEAVSAGKKMEQKAQSIEFTKEKLVGQYVDVRVERGSYNNRGTNVIAEFKPYSGPK
jgi:hypothetical protein